jgi:H+/Cl- antiporter ClcA
LIGGLLGALFSGLVLYASRRLGPLSTARPLVTGLGLGAALVLLALISGGRAYGDGSQVLVDLISRGGSLPPAEGLRVLLARLLGPVLALGAGIPGGLIDPALSIGGVAGGLLLQLFSGQDPLLGIALGMAAGLAGSTQLPIFSTLFALRLCGDQQVLPGVLLASAVAAMVSRSLQPSPVYHGLTELFRQGLATPEAPEAEPQRAPRR